MLKNNLEIDAKVKCLEEGVTQAQLAEKIWNFGSVCKPADKQERGHFE